MGRAKDQLIEQMEEEREDLEQSLDDIEAFGQLIKWYARTILQYPFVAIDQVLLQSF
jgi:putative NADPH-quinone reductase